MTTIAGRPSSIPKRPITASDHSGMKQNEDGEKNGKNRINTVSPEAEGETHRYYKMVF